MLGPLVEVVRALPLVTPADREQVLDAFDAVLTLSDDPHRSGMWGATTPRAVVDLVLELASPQPGERVYDPCFGAASMLAACARRIRARLKTSPPKAWLDAQRGAFFGVELQPEVFTIGLARMILAGVIARHTSPSAWASAVGPSGTTSMPTPPGRPRGDRLGRPAAAGK